MDCKKIVLTRFPFTDLTSTKRRPAVVLTKRKSHSTDVIVAFISSVLPAYPEATDFIFEDTHPDFGTSGLKHSSVFKMDKIATLDSGIFVGELGEVSDAVFEQLKNCLRIALDL